MAVRLNEISRLKRVHRIREEKEEGIVEGGDEGEEEGEGEEEEEVEEEEGDGGRRRRKSDMKERSRRR